MQPRFIIKTHTKSLRPGNYSILISKCTSPDRSSYPENVEKRLAEFLEKSVAKYTVLVATKKNRGFGFLLDNMIWSWKGHVINTVLKYIGKSSYDKSAYFELSKIEKIAYLKYFLETEGALILKLAEKFIDRKEITYSYLKNEIQNIFREIYEGYMDIAPDFRSRIKIREQLKETQRRIKSREHTYDQGTLAHKIKPHIQALSDLQLLTIEKENQEEIYKPVIYNGISPFAVFYKKLANFKKMEEIFSNDGYFSLIAEALNLRPIKYSPKMHEKTLRLAFTWGYEVMRNKTTGMADIEALIDWSCIKLLSEENVLITRRDIEEFLNEMRKVNPSSIRYHVDGKGRIAYLILEL
ncbi:MAG: hypothetical protein B5M53_04905 [Candidatus Cloacimonas sp. 4484_209]|nr:MAG: hypothetical protein B5M53_04905 [Candidatus Cloacimonas sp. 4484_209]